MVFWKRILGLAIVLLLSACSIAPVHPALKSAQLPDLIPIRDVVADVSATGGYSVSPDGKRLAWIGTSGVQTALWVKTIGKEDAHAYPTRLRYYRWSADSQFIAVVKDTAGDEDAHIYALDLNDPQNQMRDVTPFVKSTQRIVQVIEGGAEMVVTSNRRLKTVFDAYKLNLKTGAMTLLAQNPGLVESWGVDKAGTLRARILVDGEQKHLQIPASEDSWKTTATWGRFDTAYPIGQWVNKEGAWFLSNRGRDKLALVNLDFATGQETLVFESPDVDVGSVYFSKKTREPLLIGTVPDHPKHMVNDAALREHFAKMTQQRAANIFITSGDDNDELLTVSINTEHGVKQYLIDKAKGQVQFLGENTMTRVAKEVQLSSIKPIRVTARDGLLLHGYLTLPVAVEAKNLPTVLLVHGGPWARDTWGDNRYVQWLANRGYAVLQINYRGSSGYGRAFQDKAIGEFAGKMHDDLIDTVNWAVKSGVSDPKKIAISGGSYGGYAAMVGVTFTPEVFACAVNFVGVTDLARLLETVPPYWELGLPWWHRFTGNPAIPEQRAVMNAKSPIYKAHAVTKPVLIMHGVNDPRVKLEQSELMVAALQKEGKDVEYHTFKNAGHGGMSWNNNLTMYRKTEDFLAKCLGGRSSGFDMYQLASWLF